ncbi:MAG TPA: EpsG family protein [Sphingomonas sp.]|nr:EpsG family protein [Sphingomonas sp.]
MFWYLVVFAVLTLLALVERGQEWPGLTAAVILALMCGLRYETGFDWVEYEAHYLFAPGLFDDDIYTSVTALTYEPGFELLNRLLRTVRADFQWLIFVIGVFNMFVLYLLTRRFSPLVVVVLLWYYGFVFLTGQMATMRQALSASFIYIAFLRRNEGQEWQAILFSAGAVLIHSFAIIFAPLVFVTLKPFRASWLAVVAVVGFAATGPEGNYFVTIANVILRVVNAGVVAERLEIYSSLAGANISPVSLALVAMHLVFVAAVQHKNADDYISRAAMWSAWLSVILHAWFAPFPILWNRVMLISFPLEAIVICRVYQAELAAAFFRVRLIAIAGAGSLLALVYALTNAQSLVYEPYQNLAVVWLRGPYGTGRLRYQVIRNENNALAIEQKGH